MGVCVVVRGGGRRFFVKVLDFFLDLVIGSGSFLR